VIEGENDGVAYLEEYNGCIGCGAKVRGDDELFGECTKCGMMMKHNKCKKFVTARVSVDDTDRKRHTLTMFNNVIMQTVDGLNTPDMKRKLRSAPAMRFNIDKGDVI
jgi:hypothetical protein